MPKIKLPKINKDILSRKLFKRLIILLVLLLLIGGGWYAYSYFNNRAANSEQNKQLSDKVDNLIKEGDCEKGLNEVNGIKPSKYSTDAQTKTLDYQMQCYTSKGEYEKALVAAEELKQVQEKAGDGEGVKLTDFYIEGIKANQRVLNNE